MLNPGALIGELGSNTSLCHGGITPAVSFQPFPFVNGHQRAALQLFVVLADLQYICFFPVFDDAINKLSQLAGGYLLNTKIRQKRQEHVTNIFMACIADNVAMHYKYT